MDLNELGQSKWNLDWTLPAFAGWSHWWWHCAAWWTKILFPDFLLGEKWSWFPPYCLCTIAVIVAPFLCRSEFARKSLILLEVLNASGDVLKDLLICDVLQGREGPLHFIYSHCQRAAEQVAVGQEDAVVLAEGCAGGWHWPGHWEMVTSLAPGRVPWACGHWWHKD